MSLALTVARHLYLPSSTACPRFLSRNSEISYLLPVDFEVSNLYILFVNANFSLH